MASKLEDCLIGAGYSKAEAKELFLQNPDLETDAAKQLKFLTGREQDLLLGKRNTQLQVLAIDRVEQQVDAFLAKFPGTEKEALHSILTKSGYDYKISTVEGDYLTLRNTSYAQLNELMEAHKGTWVKGLVANKELGADLLREMAGKKTSNALAGKGAKPIRELLESLRLRFNKAGGKIGKLQDWLTTQTYDSAMIARATPEKWVELATKHFDLDRMGLKNPAEIDAILRGIRKEMASHGLDRLEPGRLPADATLALASRKSAHRQIHFKDIDGYLEFQKEFGSQDHFASILSHIDSMSKEIALMERMGPNPDLTFKFMAEKLRKSSGNQNVDRGASHVFDDVMGRTMAEDPIMADRFGSARAGIAAAKLKSAPLAAFSDLATTGVESHFAGISAMKVYGRFLHHLVSADARGRAAQVAGVVEYAMDTLAQSQRYTPLAAGSGVLNRMAALTIRGSGLEIWTNAIKGAFSMELADEIGSFLGKSLSDMAESNPRLHRLMGVYDITDADWKQLKSFGRKHQGTTYLQLVDITDNKLAAKYGTLLRGEMKMAVIEPGWRETGFMKQGTKSGTAVGESVRMGMQFKSYPVAMMMTWWARILHSQALEGTLTRASYAGSLLAATTMMGAVSVSMKDVAKGKTPMPLDSPELLLRAVLQGGTMSIGADLIMEGASGRTLEYLAGPLVGESLRLGENVLSNASRIIEGKETHFSHALLKQVSGWTPGAWHVALPVRRLMYQSLENILDDSKARQDARSFNTKARKKDQDPWWKQGEYTPEIMQ